MANVLIDTNVLVYAHDRGEFEKQQQANRALDHLFGSGAGRLSVQSLSELFRATTRGANPILTVQVAAQQVQQLAHAWTVLDLTPQIVIEAARGAGSHQLAYWDAQLWATAKLNQIQVIFTEDLPSSAVLEGVRFVNPFAADFVIEDWV